VTGQVSHPDIIQACRTVSVACKKHGKSAGIHIVRPDEKQIANAVKDGFTFIALGMDTVFLAAKARSYARRRNKRK
jgi:2-dehydro-3-deoxyglucarate aldolase